jgi:hypothetical protein
VPSLEDELRHTEEWAKSFGVQLCLRMMDGEVWMDRLHRLDGQAGSGKVAIDRLFTICDTHGIPVRAVVEDWTGVRQLLDYYERLGFTIVTEPVYDLEDDEEPGTGAKFFEIERPPQPVNGNRF